VAWQVLSIDDGFCNRAKARFGTARINADNGPRAQTGKIQMPVEYFKLDHADEAYQLLHDGKIR
jgi:hypothetical protein